MQWLYMDDDVRLFLRKWSLNDGVKPMAVLHIVHGMAEHSLRYERLAKKLNEAGIEVWAADMRGHGKTVAEGENPPGAGGLLGHCFDRDSFERVCADVDAINRLIAKEKPGVPLFLMGHSWGSFIAQYYIETREGLRNPPHPDGPLYLSGCILSGSRGPGGSAISLGLPFLSLIALFKGCRKSSSIAKTLVDGSYSKYFSPQITSFDWLSRDENEVDAYIRDFFCGNLCSSGFYRDLLILLKKIHSREYLEGIRRDLNVYVFSGSADPVGEMGKSPTALVEAYKALGMENLDFVLFPEARHETLNETNREEVSASLLAWLLRQCDK